MLYDAGATLRVGSAMLPDGFAADLFMEADVMDSMAAESKVDARRAAKASSYDATVKSRTRGRQARGGRIVLRCADGCDELVLEEWELQRVVRWLSTDPAKTLRPAGSPREAQVAAAIAEAITEDHLAFLFFAGAGGHGGFLVSRA